jgi:hypothetical protein
VFTVGQVVEFWEGAFVRGYRQAPGAPAIVKRVEGNGFYSIKMVGSMRGKFRVVGWKNLFTEGSFTKNVCKTDSKRVRLQARLKEIAEAEAEVRFAGEIIKAKDELAKAAKIIRDKVTQGENLLKAQEKEARNKEKDLSARHKRQLEEMAEDLAKRQESESQEREEISRQGRQKMREVVRNLEKTHTDLSEVLAEKEVLVKAVIRGTASLEALQKEGLGWQGKCTDQQDKMKEREILLTFLERSVVEKTRQIAVLNKQCESLANKLKERDKEISMHAELSREVSFLVFSLLFLSSDLLFSLLWGGSENTQINKTR